jgi:LPS-assembly protein
VFDDTNLFEIQKFSGTDRQETGTRVNAGVQYTFQSNSGGYARFLAGQHYQLSGDNAYADPGVVAQSVNYYDTATGTYKTKIENRFVFNPSSGLETSRSDYVLAAYLAPNSIFRFLSQTRLDEQDFSIRREDLFASANYGPISASAVYTYVAADPLLGIEKAQSDITASLGLKLTDRWSVIGAMRFDIDTKSVLTDSVTLKYADDCFVLTTTYQETYLTNASLGLTNDRSLMFRFELKNLGGANYKTSVVDHSFGDSSTVPVRQ